MSFCTQLNGCTVSLVPCYLSSVEVTHDDARFSEASCFQDQELLELGCWYSWTHVHSKDRHPTCGAKNSLEVNGGV